MEAVIAAFAAACENTAPLDDLTIIDTEPATGSIATDSATTSAIIVRAKRIIQPPDESNIDTDYFSIKSATVLGNEAGGTTLQSLAIWRNNAGHSLIRIKLYRELLRLGGAVNDTNGPSRNRSWLLSNRYFGGFRQNFLPLPLNTPVEFFDNGSIPKSAGKFGSARIIH